MAELSDQELRAQLTSLGVDVGPIVDTTRKLYLNKLMQLTSPQSTQDHPEANGIQEKNTSSGEEEEIEDEIENEVSSVPDVGHGEIHLPTLESTINLIRARKPIKELAQQAQVTRQQPQAVPFPAANAQFRKRDTDGGSMMDHVLKFGCFAVVMMVIVFFILSSNQGNTSPHQIK